MISRLSLRLPLRLKQEGLNPQCLHAKPSVRHSSTSRTQKSQWRDPYTMRLAQAKKKAAVAKQESLRAERLAAKGDPIHGGAEPTPFVRSFDLAMPESKIYIPNAEDEAVPSRPPAEVNLRLTDHESILSSDNTGVARPDHINDFLSPEELDHFAQDSKSLSSPLPAANRAVADPQAEAEAEARHTVEHATRTAALARILAVENASSEQRTRINVRRVIDEFGRHHTDATLQPRQLAANPDGDGQPVVKPRVGPDTGSSEVQIGILTAKIRVLAAEFQGRSKNDKINKRNLRVLLHRRQKLLRYFYRKDRGGERWQHMVDTLGITPAMWEGEIEVR